MRIKYFLGPHVSRNKYLSVSRLLIILQTNRQACVFQLCSWLPESHIIAYLNIYVLNYLNSRAVPFSWMQGI